MANLQKKNPSQQISRKILGAASWGAFKRLLLWGAFQITAQIMFGKFSKKKSHTIVGVVMGIFSNLSEQLFCRTAPGVCFSEVSSMAIVFSFSRMPEIQLIIFHVSFSLLLTEKNLCGVDSNHVYICFYYKILPLFDSKLLLSQIYMAPFDTSLHRNKFEFDNILI